MPRVIEIEKERHWGRERPMGIGMGIQMGIWMPIVIMKVMLMGTQKETRMVILKD
jgi:hypothetical protein